MDNPFLVANCRLVVNYLDKEYEMVPGEYLDDGTPKLRKVSRIIEPNQIFKYEELDRDPQVAREIAEGLVNDVPDWCVDINEEDRVIYTSARWANDAEVRAFGDAGVVSRG